MVAAGDPIYASDINDYRVRLVTKPSATNRISTTTLAADPHLTGLTLEAGTYDIEIVIFWTCASTTPKLKTRWGFTGTISNTLRLCHGPGSTQTAGPEAVTEVTDRAYGLTGQDAQYSTSTSAAYSAILEKAAGVVVTAVGDLSLNWAQVTSTASNVTIREDSYIRAVRVA